MGGDLRRGGLSAISMERRTIEVTGEVLGWWFKITWGSVLPLLMGLLKGQTLRCMLNSLQLEELQY